MATVLGVFAAMTALVSFALGDSIAALAFGAPMTAMAVPLWIRARNSDTGQRAAVASVMACWIAATSIEITTRILADIHVKVFMPRHYEEIPAAMQAVVRVVQWRLPWLLAAAATLLVVALYRRRHPRLMPATLAVAAVAALCAATTPVIMVSPFMLCGNPFTAWRLPPRKADAAWPGIAAPATGGSALKPPPIPCG